MKTIDAFNKALVELAKEEGYTFLNSAEVLKDSTGYAKAAYMESSDGIHLSREGMDVLFDYIRMHAHETEDTRPALKSVPTHIATPEEFFVPKATPAPESSSVQATAMPSPTPSPHGDAHAEAHGDAGGDADTGANADAGAGAHGHACANTGANAGTDTSADRGAAGACTYCIFAFFLKRGE